LSEDKGKLTSELNNRLDNLFSEEDDSPAPEPDAPNKSPGKEGGTTVSESRVQTAQTSTYDSPLMELDAIVLSLDWEITDENLEKLLIEIENLKNRYKDSRLPYMFLQLHGSVGKYIASKKVDAHPDSIKLLHSVHAGLEKVLLHPDMSENEKKKILSREVKKFKGLKHQIMLSKSVAVDELVAAPVKKTLAPATPAQPPVPTDRLAGKFDKIEQAFIDEIKYFIKEEFQELKNEIRSWKQEQK